MTKKDLEKRTKQFALRIIKFVAAFPKNKVCDVVGYQLLKAGTSIGATARLIGQSRETISFTKSPSLKRNRLRLNIGSNYATRRR